MSLSKHAAEEEKEQGSDIVLNLLWNCLKNSTFAVATVWPSSSYQVLKSMASLEADMSCLSR